MGSEGGGWGGNWEEGSYGGEKKRNKCNNLNNKDLMEVLQLGGKRNAHGHSEEAQC